MGLAIKTLTPNVFANSNTGRFFSTSAVRLPTPTQLISMPLSAHSRLTRSISAPGGFDGQVLLRQFDIAQAKVLEPLDHPLHVVLAQREALQADLQAFEPIHFALLLTGDSALIRVRITMRDLRGCVQRRVAPSSERGVSRPASNRIGRGSIEAGLETRAPTTAPQSRFTLSGDFPIVAVPRSPA